MKRLLFFSLLLIGQFAWCQDYLKKPDPPRLVNDFAHVLNDNDKDQLEKKLVAYDDSTSTQIAIVTISTIGDQSIEEIALKILRNWGVGNKKTNNGVVIVAAIQDRKIRIETGYGLEGSIPDALAKEIIENEIAPSFRNGDYAEGFNKAADAIIKAATGEYKAPDNYRTRGSKDGVSIVRVIVIIFIILFILSRINRGGGGGMMSRRGFIPWIGPAFFDWGGGRSSGGGWGGGGGGFGGFGGGSGGGGGASGGW